MFDFSATVMLMFCPLLLLLLLLLLLVLLVLLWRFLTDLFFSLFIYIIIAPLSSNLWNVMFCKISISGPLIPPS